MIYKDVSKVLQYFKLLRIWSVSEFVYKAELMEVSIDSALWKTKFCW